MKLTTNHIQVPISLPF